MAAFHPHVQSVFDSFLANRLDNAVPWSLSRRSKDEFSKRCAVLCCLREEKGEILVLITTRSQQLRRNAGKSNLPCDDMNDVMLTFSVLGDPCLPGGKEEPTDVSMVDTALREAEEEVGLRRDQVQVVAALPPILCGVQEYMQCHVVVCTVSCASVDQLDLSPSSEVDSIHWVPLRLFLGGYHHWQDREWLALGDSRRFCLDFFRVAEEREPQQAPMVVWGLTAKICVVVACVTLSETPRFPFTAFYIHSIDLYGANLMPFMLPDMEIQILSKL